MSNEGKIKGDIEEILLLEECHQHVLVLGFLI